MRLKGQYRQVLPGCEGDTTALCGNELAGWVVTHVPLIEQD